jgi:predicted RNA-binding protein YlxR (DUF448 family)
MTSGPIRTCVGCGIKKAKKDLLRLVLQDCQVVIDKECKLSGRGVYSCDTPDCLSLVTKNKKKLSSAFRVEIDIECVHLR